MSACGGDNDYVRCDIPVLAHKSEDAAWVDFMVNPGDWAAFDRYDWLARVFFTKWETYAMNRRVEASREDHSIG